MMQSSAVKWAVQPASQSCPIETRALFPSSGKRCSFVASVGRIGMLRLAVWDDCMVVLSG